LEFERTATRLWKRLRHEEKLAAARHFWLDPPAEASSSAQAALVKLLHVRPQALGRLSQQRKIVALAAVLEPGELLAAALLVALHLGERRELLAAFLDGAGLAHERGLLAEDAGPRPVSAAAALRGLRAVRGAFAEDHVHTYLNTLWLQDHDRWGVLDSVVAEDGRSGRA
jgi:hypothetical protein